MKFTRCTTEGQLCVYPHENLQYLATEIHKVKNCLSPEIMKRFLFFRKMKITVLGVVRI